MGAGCKERIMNLTYFSWMAVIVVFAYLIAMMGTAILVSATAQSIVKAYFTEQAALISRIAKEGLTPPADRRNLFNRKEYS